MRLRHNTYRLAFLLQIAYLLFPCFTLANNLPPSLICTPEDNQTCLILSPDAVLELQKGNNSYGDDILIRLSLVAKEQVDTTLRSLHMIAIRASNGVEITPFSFHHPVRLQLGHWFLFERSGETLREANAQAFAPVADARQWLSVYWNNGQSFIPLNDASLDANQTLSIPINSLGQIQVRVASAATAFHLSSGSPYPRILTPNARYNRRAFFFFSNPGSDVVTGTIYDFQGSKVRDLHVDGLSPSNSALVWDGRDAGGQVVPGGPYFYKISSGEESVTGSLVVAR